VKEKRAEICVWVYVIVLLALIYWLWSMYSPRMMLDEMSEGPVDPFPSMAEEEEWE